MDVRAESSAAFAPTLAVQAFLPSLLNSVIEAARHPGLRGEPVSVFVVLDDCTDRTRAIAITMGVHVREIEDRNVGIARATGADAALSFGARWLAFTDADTTVARDWLVQQLRCGTDVVCGTLGIQDWRAHSAEVASDFATHYRDVDCHHHIHGANLALSAQAYVRVGGFSLLEYNEDVTLANALIAAGMTIAWSAAPRVMTSARLDSRAPNGFGARLRSVGTELGGPG